MRLHLLPLVGLAIGLVIPDEQVFLEDAVSAQDRLEADSKHDDTQRSASVLDQALERDDVEEVVHEYLRHAVDDAEDGELVIPDLPDALSFATHEGAHNSKPNLTIYELITRSKYTTKLAALISDDAELVSVLNGTKANYTLFAPTDKAFEKIPDHDHEPSKEFIKSLLLNHVSGDFYPAKRVLATHTIPTLLQEDSLGGLQRLVVKLGVNGLTVNLFSRVIAINIFATNGVIHAVDSIIIRPPPTLPIIEATPTVFSTLALGLTKTGLLEQLNSTPHIGSTFFAPPNRAFAKLGPKINAFLFSKYGLKYLKALLQYHVVLNSTLYSDAFYHEDEAPTSLVPVEVFNADSDVEGQGRNGYFHVDLPTQLEDRSVAVDIARYGPFISMKVNGFTRVAYQDGPTKDGVIQIVQDVLIPPKSPTSGEETFMADEWNAMGELTVEDLIERLQPFVSDTPFDEDSHGARDEYDPSGLGDQEDLYAGRDFL